MGETLDYMYFSGFPLHFLRALAASSVLYNRTEYKKGILVLSTKLKRKLANVKSFKDDVSSVNPLSKQM